MAVDLIDPELLLHAYANGYFPMAHEGRIEWFEPKFRGLIPLDDRFHLPHGLRRVLRKCPFRIKINTDFAQVIAACGERQETWIDDTIRASYQELHRLGHAHSFECWDDDGLQGGLYGVALPGVFFGESMFSRKSNASKIALVALVEHLRSLQFSLLDTQWMTDHLRQFGGYELPRKQYLKELQQCLENHGCLHAPQANHEADLRS